MNYKKAIEVSTWLFVAAMAAIGGTFFFQGTTQILFMFAGVALIIAAILVRVIFQRCPHCKKHLKVGFKQEPMKCPYCKGDLFDRNKPAE